MALKMKGHILYLVCLLYVVLPGFLCLDPPDCDVRYDDPCIGVTASGESLAGMLSFLHNHLCGCVYVSGNIHMLVPSNFPDLDAPLSESNFSFFYHIREVSEYVYLQGIPEVDRISFPNLRIIRGESLLSNSGQYALAVFRSDIRNLYMPRLTEITKGNIRFREDTATTVPSTCNVLSVNWEDIMANNSILTTTLDKCTDQYKINCSTSLGCDYCWCNDTSVEQQCCQDLTRDCPGCSNRCHLSREGGQFCCNSVCAAGCDGGGDSDQCRACRLGNVLNGDTCESSCPPPTILQGGNTIVANPDFRFRIGGLCVLPCPRGTFELESVGECVEQCPIGMMSVPSDTGGMKCVECDSSYCKECAEGDSEDLPDNCTLILGELQISNPPPSVTPDEALGKLSSIHTIRGSLSIEKLTFEHFPFLSNLVEIGTDITEVGTFPCNGGERQRYSIFISENDDLISIDFSSLQTIYGGGISMDRNPNLCIIGNLSLFVNDSSADICLGDNYRRSFDNCTAMNQTCHPQCDVNDGCWVNNDDTHCVSCANFMFNERCVESCENFEELGALLYADDTKHCMPCDRLCNGSCSGPNATDCSICANDTFVRQGELFKCVESCEVGEYIETVNKTVGTKECTVCSSECDDDGCTGPGSTLGVCNNCTYASINETDFTQSICYDGMCATGFYPNMSDTRLFEGGKMVTNPCLPCREGCKECDGPNNCTMCVSIEGKLPTCVIQGPRIDSSTQSATIGGVVAAVLVVFLIAVVVILFVIIYKHQKLKTSKNSYHGYDPDELEMLTLEKETLQPPLVPPNAARLTVTPEDTLEFGKELGAGAFGTVYEGYWKPDEENRYHVAIKVLKNTTPAANKELLQEGVVMGSMDHENVVRLYCVCMSKQLMLVSQFVPLGALQDYLKRRKDQLSAKSILQFASQIALGMAYLETKFLVHRDLAARNVLVQSHRKVKITDFGLTRILQSDQDHYKAESSKMPVRWLPPESIRHRVFTHKTDVWGFGVTVWEILTFGARPYQGMKPFEILKQIEGGRRLDQPMTCTIELYGILLECWLPEPESRPSFEDLHERLKEMTKDPSRYVLTVQDGNASDYGQLPSNERRENETVYETPFAGDVSLDNSLPSNIHIDPYNEHNGAVPISGKGDSFEKKQPPSAYEVATQGSLTQEQSPRYVKVNIGQNQPFPEFPGNNSVTDAGYDYIDEEKLLQQQQQDSNTQPLYINKSNPSSNGKAPLTNTISGHYETQRNNAGAIVEDFYDVEQSYEQPMDGQTTKNPSLINETYDSNIGTLGGAGSIPKGAPPTDNYEEPVDSELLKQEMESLSNPVYDANPNNVVPETYNYEEMDEEPEKRPNTTSFDNAMYDSAVTGDNQVPPIGEYETIDEEDLMNDGIDNSTYDSSVGIGSLPPGSGGFHNLMYEAAATNDNQVPPIGEYEVIDEEDLPPAPTDLHNPTYDSGPVPNGLINATYDSGPINPAPNGLINATYDSRPHVANNNVRESQVDGLVNKMYDSRAGVSTDSSLPPNGGLINSTYDSMAGATNGETPPINDYEELDEDDEVLVPETDNYEEVGPELSPDPQKGGVINMTYDSTPFLTKEPSTEDRVASPYEVPMIQNDYELPHDGDPSINIYDAPHS